MALTSKQQKENKITIDAAGTVVGKLASFAAKQALLGKQVSIVNSENAIIVGNKKSILEKYSARRSRGKGAQKGPFFPRKPEAILKRAIRGMLPFDRARGIQAFKNIKCYAAIPAELEPVEKISLGKVIGKKSLKLSEISSLI